MRASPSSNYRRTDVKIFLSEHSSTKGYALSAAFCAADVEKHAEMRVAFLTRVVRYMVTAKVSKPDLATMKVDLREEYEACKTEVLEQPVDDSESSGDDESGDTTRDDAPKPAAKQAPKPQAAAKAFADAKCFDLDEDSEDASEDDEDESGQLFARAATGLNFWPGAIRGYFERRGGHQL